MYGRGAGYPLDNREDKPDFDPRKGIDQLWIADITYIRLKTEFVYVAVIRDALSRKVAGWALGRTLASRLAIKQRMIPSMSRPANPYDKRQLRKIHPVVEAGETFTPTTMTA